MSRSSSLILKVMLEVIFEQNLAPMKYEEALRLQYDNCEAKRSGWMFFAPLSVITLSRRSETSDILCSPDVLKKNKIEVLPVSRGGLTTFHGPGQILGFPFGTLESHVRDSRGVKQFMCELQNKLATLISEFCTAKEVQVLKTLAQEPMGIWLKDRESTRKVVAFGLQFSRNGFQHGFSINLYPETNGNVLGFQMIVACGNPKHQPGYVFQQKPTENDLSAFESRLTELFQNRGGSPC